MSAMNPTAHTEWLPNGWNGTVQEPRPKRCCAKCKTPYGHAAEAGICCHAEEKATR
ncbi:hypothetical protein [Cryobacterium cryoconiti]|uniref:hypothetical protein n=1 Tax=Cryobacterium cryoconiti TaxID=1259239 RepID=UPI00141A8A29|nr:hypothetical protein [Cryobacterium cryoconiti]